VKTGELFFIYVLIFASTTTIVWLLYHAAVRGFAIYRERFQHDIAGKFHTMFVFIDGRTMFLTNLVAIIVLPTAVYFISGNLLLVVMAAIIAVFFPRVAVSFLRKRRIDQFVQTLPDTLTQIAGGMRAGGSFPKAVEVVARETTGPISQELTLLLREMRIGVSMDDALENLGARVPAHEVGLVVSAARIAREVGGNLAETFERLAETLRQKMAMEGKIKALTSQGKLQGWVVGALPFGIMFILFQMEPKAMHPLLTSVLGWGFLAVIIILELLGMLMIRKIVSIDV
jgi:tight adherence protein B